MPIGNKGVDLLATWQQTALFFQCFSSPNSSAPKQENVADFESTLFVDRTPKGTSKWNRSGTQQIFPKKNNLQKWLDIFDARFPKEVYTIY